MNHNCNDKQNNSCSHGCCEGNDHGCCGGDNIATISNATSYTCPMHPNVKQDKPGSCPECGMNLVPVK